MITREQLTEIGSFNKTHGILGEISATFLCETEAVKDLHCLVMNMDGIFVPFFTESIRDKNEHTSLLKFEGIETDKDIKPFVGKKIYALKSECDEIEEDENDIYYFIGFTVYDSSIGKLGKIVGVDDTTENYLFVVDYNDSELLIPVAVEFIDKIDDEDKKIDMTLPTGIIDL